MPVHFEDLAVGDTATYGPYEMTEAEIVEFAERFDPQPMHTEPAAAAEGPYGGLIASGWHTASACMSLIVEGFLLEAATLGSPGVEELRWPAPVRPGDVLTVETEVVDTRASESSPERGTARVRIEGRNQDGTIVLSMTAAVLFARRDAS